MLKILFKKTKYALNSGSTASVNSHYRFKFYTKDLETMLLESSNFINTIVLVCVYTRAYV